ncbi:MAG TPA: glycosyltransferase family 4 protein [Terriglobales bacterium]|nr:glycosyltransferase family 4 protein [Terriglobales bacterium]
MKILYVSQYFSPETGAPAARAAELAQYWVQDGHEVTVLTGFPNHPNGIVLPNYRGMLRRPVMREEISGVKVVRTWLFPFPNRKAHERMLNYSSFCVSAATTGMFLPRPDVLIATSPQLLVGLSGWWLARLKGAPFVFEVRDLWPESLVAVGMSNANSMLSRSLGSIAGFLYRRADHVVVVTPAFEDYLVRSWHVPAEKISVVENGVNTDLFSPRLDNVLRSELAIDEKFVVSYIGTMGMAHGLDTLVEVATELRQTAPEVLFLMVGEGADKARIIQFAGSRRLSNMRFINQQPREKVPEFISASDVCLVPLKKTELFKTVVPTKMLEFMSCARPVILGVDGQARRILDLAAAGIFVEPQNATALAQAIRKLATNPVLRETLGHNGRRYVVENFSRQQTAKTYLTVLGKILNKESRQTPAAA